MTKRQLKKEIEKKFPRGSYFITGRNGGSGVQQVDKYDIKQVDKCNIGIKGINDVLYCSSNNYLLYSSDNTLIDGCWARRVNADGSNYYEPGIKIVHTNVKKDVGVKESLSDNTKAPVFRFCTQFKDAIHELSLRSLYGHNKYIEHDEDWLNFTRVPDTKFTYGDAEFRHALGFGEEDEEGHLVAGAWSAMAKLQCYLLEKNKSK